MAFNLGAFAGGLAKGGMDTYTTMKSIGQKDEEMKLRKQEAEFSAERAARERADYAEKQSIQQAAQQTYGAIGKPQTFVGGDMGPAPEGAPQYKANLATQDTLPYTEAQANKDYLTKVRAINPEKAASAEATQLGLTSARRTEGYAQKQENALGFQQNVLSDLAETKGDIGSVLQKHFIPLYNDNKLPGLADGGTAKVVPNAMGGGSSIMITDKDGKEKVLPADIKTLQMLTGKAQELMMASSSPENYWKHKDQFIKERTVGAQETSAGAAVTTANTHAAQLEAQIKANLFGAQANQANAAANASNAHSALYNNMVKMANEKSEAGAAMKPFIERFAALTPEEQAGTIGQGILTEGALAAAKKSGDVTGLLAQLKKPDRSAMSAEYEKAAYAEYQGAGTPAAQNAVKAKYPLAFGPSALDTAIAAKAKGGTTPPATAIPTVAAAAPAGPTPPSTMPTALPTRQNQFAAADAAEATTAALEQRAAADPEMRALRLKLADNARSGDPRNKNAITQEIIDLRKTRYGL